MARLDRLGPAKEVIQVGSVIGSEFSYELLRAVHPIAEEVWTTLSPGIEYEVQGTPKDLEGARDLAARDKYQFQWWAVSLVNAVPFGGKKKGSDSGIDGLIYFYNFDGKGKVATPSRARAWYPCRREHSLLCRRNDGSDSPRLEWRSSAIPQAALVGQIVPDTACPTDGPANFAPG
jgi:hypothetical protein